MNTVTGYIPDVVLKRTKRGPESGAYGYQSIVATLRRGAAWGGVGRRGAAWGAALILDPMAQVGQCGVRRPPMRNGAT